VLCTTNVREVNKEKKSISLKKYSLLTNSMMPWKKSPLDRLENTVRQYPGFNKQPGHPMPSQDMSHLAMDSKETLSKVWGTYGNDRVIAANTLAFFSLFQIPEIIDTIHKVQPGRYNEEDISEQVRSSADGLVFAVGSYNPEMQHDGEATPVYIRPARITYGQHHPSFRKQDPDLRSHGIPNIAMAYFFHEVIRASELFAQENGIVITAEDREVNYRYLGHILKLAKYSFPDEKERMEELAVQVDELAHYSPKVAELTDRLFRLNAAENHGLKLPVIEKFLRNNSKDVFEQVSREYAFQ